MTGFNDTREMAGYDLLWLSCEQCPFMQKVPHGLSPGAIPGAWLALGVHLGRHVSECNGRVYDSRGPGHPDVPVSDRTYLDDAITTTFIGRPGFKQEKSASEKVR